MVKFSSNDIFWILLFLYFSFEVQNTNTFIRSRGSLENHTQFKTIMVKIYIRFQTKNRRTKTIPFGAAHTYITYIVPPPRGVSGFGVCAILCTMLHACVSEFHNCEFTNLVSCEQNTALQHVKLTLLW